MPRTRATISDDASAEELEAVDQLDDAGAKVASDFKNLVLLGRLEEDVDISGYTFTMTTLSARGQRDIMKHIMSLDEMDRILGAKAVAVAYSIKSVNGTPLFIVSKDNEGETDMERNLDFILSLQSSVIERLYAKYEELVQQSGKEVGLETLKK